MYSRLIKPPARKNFFLFDSRGTGKTTWVRAAFPDSIYIDLLEAELFNDLTANPQRLGNIEHLLGGARTRRREKNR